MTSGAASRFQILDGLQEETNLDEVVLQLKWQIQALTNLSPSNLQGSIHEANLSSSKGKIKKDQEISLLIVRT